MNWAGMLGLFGASTIKFSFAPFAGELAKLTFIDTYVSCCSGAIFSAAIFYFSANYFIKKSIEKKAKNMRESLDKGVANLVKFFTRTNKFVVYMKRSVGIIGIAFWGSIFLIYSFRQYYNC